MAKAKTNDWIRISGYLFLAGIVVSILGIDMFGSLIPMKDTLLVVLGAVIGLLGAFGIGSIDRESATEFLIAVVALSVAGAQGGSALADLPEIGVILAPILKNIATFVIPAAAILAMEGIWVAGSTKL
jgi:hypothetical protein